MNQARKVEKSGSGARIAPRAPNHGWLFDEQIEHGALLGKQGSVNGARRRLCSMSAEPQQHQDILAGLFASLTGKAFGESFSASAWDAAENSLRPK